MSDLALEKVRETSMVDLAYDLLKHRGEAMRYSEIMDEVAKLKGFSDEDVENYIAQLFTELNIDGRFVRDQDRKWGLKEWYTLDEIAGFAVAANTKDEEDDFEAVADDDDFIDPYTDEDEEGFEDAGDLDLDEEDYEFGEDEDAAPFDSELDEEKLEADEDEEDL